MLKTLPVLSYTNNYSFDIRTCTCSVYLFRILQASEADPNSLWEDEDTRSFYEGITDIKPFVPAVSHTPTINYIIIWLSCDFFYYYY